MNDNDNDLPFKNDPYAFMAYVAEISSSQEDLLRVCRFVGELDVSQDDVVNHDDVHLEPSSLPNTGGNSVDPTPIIFLSDDNDDGKDNSTSQDDAFYTQLEQSPLLTSSDGFEICQLNQMPDLDDIEADCEDFGRDSDLGFRGVEFNEFPVIERESLSLKDDSGQPVPKKLKLFEKNLCFGNSSGGCFGTESQNVIRDVAICKGKMVSEAKNPCNFAYDGPPQHNILDNEERSVCVGENAGKLPSNDEGNESTENAIGTSDRSNRTEEELFVELLGLIQRYFECSAKERGLEIGKGQQEQKGKGKAVVDDNEECVEIGEGSEKICEAENLTSIGEKVAKAVEGQRWTDKQMLCLVNGEMILKSEKGRQKEGSKTGKGSQQEHKVSVLDALRVVKELETENEAEQDYNPQGASLLEAAMGRGWNFPRPRWWSEKCRYMNSNKK